MKDKSGRNWRSMNRGRREKKGKGEKIAGEEGEQRGKMEEGGEKGQGGS